MNFGKSGLLALVVVAAASCSDDTSGMIIDRPPAPVAIAQVKGRVTDPSGARLKFVVVRMYARDNLAASYLYSETTTDGNGNFAAELQRISIGPSEPRTPDTVRVVIQASLRADDYVHNGHETVASAERVLTFVTPGTTPPLAIVDFQMSRP